ncbi:hypothetical protein [Ruthenibacterium lactatiformans]|uniref:hypothetical protein n=1 Tax=Ruthenibacterium lactatiformans TaxID=1550024 RepID=UPI0039F57A8A
MNSIAEDNLMHYGTPRHSGRYPWGSGDNPYQRSGDFLSRIEELKNQGLTETEIAKAMGMSTTQYRAQKSLAKDERRALDVARAKSLREDGLSLNEIAREMGFANDSSVRSLLNERSEARMNQAKKTAEFLKEQIAEKGMIDVGTGVERELGISKEKLKEALAILEAEGYPVYGGRIQQATNPGKHTTLQVVCPPGTEHKEIYDYDNIHSVKDYISYDDGESFRKSFVYPESMDSSRLKIRYAEDGGIEKDGVIEIRRGVEDLSLGESHYAQVRILVDGNRYLKGMAVYSDDLPDGVDVVFNTNKKQGTPTGDVLKKITNDPENPFGSLIKEHGGQSYYDDPNGKYTDPVTGKKQSLSLINKRAEEGDWGEWSDHLPSQFLSKQSMTLINKQLDLATKDKFAEFDEICSLTNPTVKKALLKSFADDCDSAAVHLQAAALPRQKYQVIVGTSRRFNVPAEDIPITNDAVIEPVRCNILPARPSGGVSGTYALDAPGISLQNNQSVSQPNINIRVPGCKTLEEIKAWLTDNPLTVYYQSTSYNGANGLDICLTEYQNGSIELDGTESNLQFFSEYQTLAIKGITTAGDPSQANAYGVCISSHFALVPPGTSTTLDKVVYGQPQYNQIIIHDTSWNSLETAKAYLAAQKAAGTPVQIAYQLATPEVYATDPVDFDNAAGPLTVLTGGELEAAFKSADKVVESRIDFVEDTLNEQGQAIAEKAPISHSSDKSTYGLGSGSQFGHVKLSDATASGSNAGQGIAATPSAVNQVNARVSTVDGIARAAMPKSGGTFTGNVLASSVNEAGAFLRNISVQNSASQSQYTNFIIMVRK